MIGEAVNVAIMGFTVVFLTLFILTVSVKVMSVILKKTPKKGGK